MIISTINFNYVVNQFDHSSRINVSIKFYERLQIGGTLARFI